MNEIELDEKSRLLVQTEGEAVWLSGRANR